MFTLLTPLEANYCIQVLSMDEKDKNFIVNEAKSVNYAAFPKVRVERRGHYLTFRIGDYPRYRSAQKDIVPIKRMHSGAYIRKCEIQPENIIYMQREPFRDAVQSRDDIYVPNKRSEYKRQKKEEPVLVIIPEPVYEEKTVEKKRHLYKKPQELHYEEPSSSVSSNSSLWNECKRCFAPVYEEEPSDTQQYPTEAVAPKRVPTHKSEEIEVNVQSADDSSDDGFWSQETQKSKSIKHKKKSIYNIDEQYLP